MARFFREENEMNNLLVRTGRLVGLACATVFLLTGTASAQNDGAAVYKSNCAVCHGADGKGETPMGKSMKLRDLGSADVQKQTDAQLTEITTNGKNKMPAYKGKLTADQVKQLVSYMRTMAKK
jgi:mono/diheme cytochrome c family protein